MTITRWLITAVVFAGVAMGSAAPAGAAEPFDGVYAYTRAGAPPATWLVYSTCVPEGCVLHVASSTPRKVTDAERAENYTGDARLTSGLWTLVTPKRDGVLCPDGSTGPSVDTYAFDNATLTGTLTSARNAVCGMPPTVTKEAFNLTYLGPLPIPVDRYPLICNARGRCF